MPTSNVEGVRYLVDSQNFIKKFTNNNMARNGRQRKEKSTNTT